MKGEAIHNTTALLRKLVSIPSFSGEEQLRADFLIDYFAAKSIPVERIGNNLIVRQPHFDPARKTVMLNSHLDTVQPASGYTFDPFRPPYSEKQIFGLGSNDAGAGVVAMIAAFLHFYSIALPFNLLLALSCEEENSGANGMKRLWKELSGSVDCAIIGEPTGMKAAIAERGLLVIDAEATGVSGHAARNEGINAIYIALQDIETLRSFSFERLSPTMGAVKLTVTQIHSGTQHNVVPDRCSFVVDIRPTEQYSNSEIMELLQPKVKSRLKARSLHNSSSATPPGHPLLRCAEALGIECYTSPTTSDWMRIRCPALKMGPGVSARSHRADEYVTTEELSEGITGYIRFIENLKQYHYGKTLGERI